MSKTMLFGILLSLAGVGSFLMWLQGRAWNRNMREKGATVMGMLLKKELLTYTKNQKGTYFRIEFKTAEGRTFNELFSVSRQVYDAHAEGSTVPIMYMPDDPVKSIVKAELDLEQSGFDSTPIWSGALLAVGVALLFGSRMGG